MSRDAISSGLYALLALAHVAAALCGVFGPTTDPLTGDTVFITSQAVGAAFWFVLAVWRGARA